VAREGDGMKARTWLMMIPVLLMSVLASGLLPGCEVGSADNVIPNSEANFSGNYANPNGGAMVTRNSGSAVTSLNISQFGNQLNAVDNNGILFKGTLGDVVNSAAAFTLEGSTTAGAPVTVNGNLSGSGSTATMNGVWAEPSFFSSIYGQAGISPITNSPSTNTTSMIRVRWNRLLGTPLPLACW
jgi:hypothetical protein